MKEATIYGLLLGVLDAYAVANGLDIAPEDRPYAPKTKTIYLRPTLLMGKPEPYTIGRGMALQPGIMQIDILSPRGSGWKAPLEVGEGLCRAFRGGLKLADDGVELTVQGAGVGPRMHEEERSKRPVSVYFRAFMANE